MAGLPDHRPRFWCAVRAEEGGGELELANAEAGNQATARHCASELVLAGIEAVEAAGGAISWAAVARAVQARAKLLDTDTVAPEPAEAPADGRRARGGGRG